jgi:hypothetical protein
VALRGSIRIAVLCVLSSACRNGEAGTRAEGASGGSNAEPGRPHTSSPVDTGRDAKVAEIPSGTLVLGSTPGDILRDAALEMDDVPVKLGAFEIERRPRPERGVSHDAAEAMCRSDGMRLCDELEWERACKGPDNLRFASGDAWRADRPSPFGVREMGALREWTRNRWGATVDENVRGYVVHGGGSKQGEAERRCAARRALAPEGDPAIGFRCCKGTPPSDRYVMERTRSPFHKLVIPEQRFQEIVRGIPELALVHDEPHLFSDADVDMVLGRAGYHHNEPASQGWTVTWSPIMWSPRQGEQMLVLAGRGKVHSFVAALHRLRGDRYTHAASMILMNDTEALAVGFGGDRKTIAWANCWGCTEGGFLLYEEDRRVRITHR